MKSEECKVSGRRTRHIQLDTSQCEACFKCVEACQKHVIGKVNFFFHKHAVFRHQKNAAAAASV